MNEHACSKEQLNILNIMNNPLRFEHNMFCKQIMLKQDFDFVSTHLLQVGFLRLLERC